MRRAGIGMAGLSGKGGGTRAPGISFSGTIEEGATTGRAVGTATLANPPEDIGTLTWSETGTGTGAALFAINSSTGAVTNSAAIDYETATSYTYEIQATDGVYTYTRLLTISVTNVFEEADLVDLSGTFSLAENAAANAVAGAISGKTSGSTLSLADDAGGRVAISGTNIVRGATALDYESAASHSFTLRETLADSSNSPHDTVLSLTVTNVDDVAPTLSSPADAANGQTGATISVSTNEGNGTLYWFVSTSSSPPSVANLKAGTGAASYGSQSVSGTGTQNASPTGLTASTDYYTYFLHTDAAANDSTIAAADGFTTAALAAPSAFAVGDWSLADATSGGTLSVTISSLPANGGSAITSVQYRVDGGTWTSSGGTVSFNITGLTDDVEVDIELRAVNAVGNGAASDVKSATPTATADPVAIVAIAFGDSTWEGVIGPREAGDTDWTGVYEWKLSNTISSDTTDMERFAGSAGSLCPQEYWGKERHADTGLPVYMVQSAVGGSGLENAAGWAAPSGTNLTNAVSRANAAIAAVIASVGSPVKIEFTGDIGTNDETTASAATWFGKLDDMVDYFRANVYKNGVSGATVGTDGAFGFVVPQPEWACINSIHREIAFESRRMAGTKTNCYVYAPANGQTAGDNLHPTLVGARANGTGLANAFAETVAPTVSFADFSIYSGQKLKREITADKIAWFTLSGTDAAEFEIYEEAASTSYGGGDLNAAQTKFYLRFASNGNAPAAGTYNINIVAKGNAASPTVEPVVITVVAAYGSATETIVPTWTNAVGFTDVGSVMRSASVNLKRGVNVFSCFQVAGGAVMTSSAVASNGLVGVADAANSGTNATYYFYSAQDETVTIDVGNSGTSSANWGFNVNLVGTAATPSSVVAAANAADSGSMTVPTNGIGVVSGFSIGDLTPPSGQTALTDSPTDAAQYAGYRTTTGVLGATSSGGFAKLFATTWAKA